MQTSTASRTSHQRTVSRILKTRPLVALAAFLITAAIVHAGNLPEFPSDTAADQWLRETSPYYRMMATQVEARASYTFRPSSELTGLGHKLDRAHCNF